MRVEKASKLGLCFGVRRAIKLLQETASKYGEIETLGPVAHNRLLVETLANVGIKPVYRLDQIRGKILAITTHGTSPAVLSQLSTRHIKIVDATCPIVRKAQNIADELSRAGFHVVIFGEKEHPEVKGLLGWTGDKGIAALNLGQMDSWGKSASRLGIISQTTQSRTAFREFARQLVSLLGAKTKEIRILDTLCQIIQAEQEAAMRLARRTELMIVVGGTNSANTRRLVEICSPLVETHLVETADEMDNSWLLGKHHIGLTAGASTPDEAVEQLLAKLRSSQSLAKPTA